MKILKSASGICVVVLLLLSGLYHAISVDLCHRGFSEAKLKEMELECNGK